MEQNEGFVLIYDIPTGEAYFKKRINRMLNMMKAEMVQRSAWKSYDLNGLTRIATLIKNVGGRARIMEERLIFE